MDYKYRDSSKAKGGPESISTLVHLNAEVGSVQFRVKGTGREMGTGIEFNPPLTQRVRMWSKGLDLAKNWIFGQVTS